MTDLLNLDRSRLQFDTLSSDKSNLDTGYTSGGTVGGWEMSSCSRDLDVRLAEIAGISDLEVFDVAGGTLKVSGAEMNEGIIRSAFWQGRQRSLVLAGASSLDGLIRLLSLVGIADTEDGLGLGLTSGLGWDMPPTVRKVVKDVGLVNVYRTGHPGAPPLPSWKGTEVRPGVELYNGDKENTAYFVIVQRNVVATVVAPKERENEAINNSVQLSLAFVD